MNNITNYSHRKFDFKVSNRKTFDFQLADYDKRDDNITPQPIMSLIGGLSVQIQSNWSGLVTSNEVISTYGLTAIDNGAVNYVSESSITTTSLIMPDNFELKEVAGNNGDISYLIIPDIDFVSFRGGFYQGFYKLDGYNYQSLPNRYKKGWTINTSIKPVDSDAGIYTLNDDERDTSGFFFYTGTRAENKFWNTFEKDNGYEDYPGVQEAGFIIPINPPRRVVRSIDNGFLIYGRSSGHTFCGTKKGKGFGTNTANDYDQGTSFSYLDNEESLPENINQFLKYGRSSGHTFCGGKSIDDEKGYGQNVAENDEIVLINELDIFDDIIDNAIGFRVKDDGSIGFRRILPIEKNGKCVKIYNGEIEIEKFIFKYTKNGAYDGDIVIEFNDVNGNQIYPEIMDENGLLVDIDMESLDMGDYEGGKCIIYEEYSPINLIDKTKFHDVTLKWVPNRELSDDCGENDDPRFGELYLYINGYLKHIFNDFKEIFNGPLYEHKGKQVGVSYNISIGGGTQGLKENRTLGDEFNNIDPADLNLPLEQYFGGCFIGDMKYFKLYESPLTWCEIKNEIL